MGNICGTILSSVYRKKKQKDSDCIESDVKESLKPVNETLESVINNKVKLPNTGVSTVIDDYCEHHSNPICGYDDWAENCCHLCQEDDILDSVDGQRHLFDTIDKKKVNSSDSSNYCASDPSLSPDTHQDCPDSSSPVSKTVSDTSGDSAESEFTSRYYQKVFSSPNTSPIDEKI